MSNAGTVVALRSVAVGSCVCFRHEGRDQYGEVIELTKASFDKALEVEAVVVTNGETEWEIAVADVEVLPS